MKALPARPQPSPAQIAALTAVLVGLGLLALGAIHRHTLQKYRAEGVHAEARVTDKSDEDQSCIGVSFFDKDLLEGGELYLTEICGFVTNNIWRGARVGGHEMVIFLPEDPENHVIFAASLENDQQPSFIIGGVFLAAGIAVLGWQKIKNRR